MAANEVLAAVYGREGYMPYYKRNMVTSVSFVVFDTKTEKSRTVGVSPRPPHMRFDVDH